MMDFVIVEKGKKMPKYINLERARFEAERYFQSMDEIKEDLDTLFCMLQTEDVAPVKHGRWIEHKHFHHDHYIDSTYECSECKVEEPLTSDYCPNCGAKMDGECGA